MSYPPAIARDRFHPSSLAASRPDRLARRWGVVLAACVAVWLIMRLVFFTGLMGSDDMYHLRYAVLWDRTPVNHWEARLLANVLIGLSVKVLGWSEWAAVLPAAAASLAILGSLFHYARRIGDLRVAFWGGLLLAMLPIDVEAATSISAVPIMVAWLTVGTVAWLDAAHSRRARYLAAVCLGFGVVTHLSAAYYVAALLGASVCIGRRAYLRPVAAVVVSCAAIVALDMAVFHFLFGDVLGRFHACQGQVADYVNDPKTPVLVDGRFNWRFATWPVVHLMFSKGFGVALAVGLGAGVCMYRRLGTGERILLLSALLCWLWMSYGSQVPWAYVPFWRMTRFVQPATLAVAVFFGLAVARARRPVTASLAGVAVLGIGLLNLAGSGSDGQNVRISRELLAYANQHPGWRFVTDYHTLNEMYLIGGLTTPANVATTNDMIPSQLLDSGARRLAPDEALTCDAILDNPLNRARTPQFEAWLKDSAGALLHQTEPAYRSACEVLPALQRFSWSVRKPAARVFARAPRSGAP
jgi:hypothetical protein